MAVPIRGRTLTQLLKQGWNEIPEVLGGTALALIGISAAFYGTWRYNVNDGDNRKYKNTYVIMRPDDPRAKFVHKD